MEIINIPEDIAELIDRAACEYFKSYKHDPTVKELKYYIGKECKETKALDRIIDAGYENSRFFSNPFNY